MKTFLHSDCGRASNQSENAYRLNVINPFTVFRDRFDVFLSAAFMHNLHGNGTRCYCVLNGAPTGGRFDAASDAPYVCEGQRTAPYIIVSSVVDGKIN